MAMARFISETMAEELSTGCSEEHARADDVGTDDRDYDMAVSEQRDPVRILPGDVLADVFRRLAPRWLAASRCVRRDWRAAIDAGRHLRADLLPLSFHGIFLHFVHHKFPEFFARPSSSTGSLAIDFLPHTDTSIKESDHTNFYRDWRDYDILHHCNGLLLLGTYVVNPATRRWDPLPPPPRVPSVPMMDGCLDTIFRNYLVFDPTLSPHYEVFRIPHLCTRDYESYFDPLVEKPSSTCILRVFSSRSCQWEFRSCDGEGDVVGNVSKVMSLLDYPQFGVNWRGGLYVLRADNFVVRVSLSSNKYRLIRLPVGVGLSIRQTHYLDRSKNGVYFAALDNYRLQVWILNESSSCGQMEWILKQDKDLEPMLARHRQVQGRWMLKDVNYNLYCSHLPKYKKNEEKIEWNSNTDDLETEGYSSGESKKAIKKQRLGSREDLFYAPKIRILGFHPYREVVFLSESMKKGLAFHLTTSRVESLGNMYPTTCNHCMFCSHGSSIRYSFTYTPCWLEESPRHR